MLFPFVCGSQDDGGKLWVGYAEIVHINGDNFIPPRLYGDEYRRG